MEEGERKKAAETKVTEKEQKKGDEEEEKVRISQAIHVREGDTPITGYEICGPREREGTKLIDDLSAYLFFFSSATNGLLARFKFFCTQSKSLEIIDKFAL